MQPRIRRASQKKPRQRRGNREFSKGGFREEGNRSALPLTSAEGEKNDAGGEAGGYRPENFGVAVCQPVESADAEEDTQAFADRQAFSEGHFSGLSGRRRQLGRHGRFRARRDNGGRRRENPCNSVRSFFWSRAGSMRWMAFYERPRQRSVAVAFSRGNRQ